MAGVRFNDKDPILTGDISTDDIIPITDLSNPDDDKKITLGQIATFAENQNSSIAGTKIFQNGVELQKGSIAFGQYSPLPTGIGSYIAQYTHPTYGARLLGYNGSAYQDLSIGSMPTAGTFSMKSLANGNCNFGYNVNIAEDLGVTGDITANKFIGDGSELTGISSGVSIFDNKGTVTTNITLAENKITTGYWSGTNTITLPTVTDTTKQVVCILNFTTATSSQPTITNTNLKWSDKNSGKPPTSYSIISGVQNLLVFKSVWISSVLYWEAEYTTYGGVEKTFIQPTLSADGSLGGSSFAIYVSNYYGSTYGYLGFDNNSGTYWGTALTSGVFCTIYNPIALKVSSISIKNRSDGAFSITGYTIYGSNDNSNWTTLTTGSNSTTAANAEWSIAVNSTDFYKYYKIYISSSTCSGTGFTQATLNAIYIA